MKKHLTLLFLLFACSSNNDIKIQYETYRLALLNDSAFINSIRTSQDSSNILHLIETPYDEEHKNASDAMMLENMEAMKLSARIFHQFDSLEKSKSKQPTTSEIKQEADSIKNEIIRLRKEINSTLNSKSL